MLFRPLVAAALLACLAAPAIAETIKVSDNHGGSVALYNSHWAGLAARGVNVAVVGPCKSACTVLLGHIPRERICVTPNASFGFHLAKRLDATQTLREIYPGYVKQWISAHGGLAVDLKWMRAPDTYRYFKRCKGA
jgi:hypothetical protein